MNRFGFKIFFACGFFGLLLGLVHGCKVTRQVDRDVVTTDLPVYLGPRKTGYLELTALFLVSVDGNVEKVQLANSSGDTGWDEAAIDSMMNWRFPPPSSESKVWLRRTIRVDLIESEKLNLGQISARSLEDAEILYDRLRAGVSFESLLRDSWEAESLVKRGRYLRDMDPTAFPLEVSRQLMALKPGQYTKPIEMHGGYYIFKRYDENLPRRSGGS